MLSFKSAYGTADTVDADIHVLLFLHNEEHFMRQCRRQEKHLQPILREMYKRGDFTGKEDEEEFLPAGDRRYVAVGLGPVDRMSPEMLRRAAARAMKKCAKYAVERVALHLLDEEMIRATLRAPFEDQIQPLVEGAALSLYSYQVFKEKDKNTRKGRVAYLTLVTSDEGFQGRLKRILERTATVCEAVEQARDLVNTPANRLNAEILSKTAVEKTRRYGVRSVVFRKKEIEGHAMEGLLAVNRGSSNEPRFLILEYNMEKKKLPCVVLIGKGVTFDSGGISLKPSARMWEMKMDMSGAAAVIATLQAVARLKLPLRVVGLIPATDNMPSGSALCPGDIIRMSNGVSVEVEDTDAEGRLILADALVYAQRYKPRAVIDLATLTGAVVVALGQHVSGVMGTSEELIGQLKEAGIRSYERICELPLYEEYEKQIKSDVADVKNIGGRWAGAITAAIFLKRFTGGYPWAHLDIAGTAILEEESHYHPKGGSGVGVRLLVEFLSGFRPPSKDRQTSGS